MLQILLAQTLEKKRRKKKLPCRKPNCPAIWKNPTVLQVLLLLSVLPVAVNHRASLQGKHAFTACSFPPASLLPLPSPGKEQR